MPTLTTARLTLRRFRSSDLDAYARMCADPEVRRYVGTGKPVSRDEAWRHIAAYEGQWSLDGYGMWAVCDRETDVLLGRVGAWFPEGWPGLELGWLLGREYWGRGYATEATIAARDFLFDELGVPELISLIHPENVRSIAVAERLGEMLLRRIDFLGKELLVYGISAPQPAAIAVRSMRDDESDRVIDLWRQTDLTRPWNDPQADLEASRRGAASDVLVAVANGHVVGTVMVGHDGHRGWVYYLAVDPAGQLAGIGRALMDAAERWVARRGIVKMNLMVRGTNRPALGFYDALNYEVQDVVTLGRRLD